MKAAISSLSSAEFPDFFTALYGCQPFAWQTALAERIVDGKGWPEAIDVPTGFGKTAAIDVAVFSLAVQATRPPADRTAPTRIFMVVDRRVIVDQSYERARQLAVKLAEKFQTEDPGILGNVARRLRSLCAATGNPKPLEVVRMRGGATWTSAWLESPVQPAVVCGTVDQVGSRLLFRGYGVSQHRLPIDAALIGTDRLLILDEAHLALPFITTAQSVSDEESLASDPVLPRRRPSPVLLSATLPLGEQSATDVFHFHSGDETSDSAQDRLRAQRHVRLVDLKSRDPEDLVAALADAALHALAQPGTRVLVVANTVSLARQVYERLQADVTGNGSSYELALLIGRCRPAERDLIARKWLLPPDGRLSADVARDVDKPPVIAVSTQTVEVGADLDVDALVTECCPLDALLQRLGRLDRRGTRGSSETVVVHQASRHDRGDTVPVYGQATTRTWNWLVEVAGKPTATTVEKLPGAIEKAPVVDLGPSGIDALLSSAERAALASEPPLCPIVLGPQFAAWARTSPVPVPDQDVAPFLHGIDRGMPTANVCWRALDSDDREAWEDELRTAPMLAHEIVSVTIGEAKRFLAGEQADSGADLEGAGSESTPDEGKPICVKAWLVDPEGSVSKLETVSAVKPGVTIAIPSGAGGHDEWGWTGKADGTVVPDVADLGPVARVRLRETIVDSLITDIEGIPKVPSVDGGDDVREVLVPFMEAIAKKANEASMSRFGGLVNERFTTIVQTFASSKQVKILPCGPDDHMWYLVRVDRSAIFDVVSDDDPIDAGTSAVSSRVGLDEHLHDVEKRAQSLAEAVGLPPPLQRAVALAGLAHDLGKADPRFQVMLYGGNALGWEASGVLLAKSGMDPADRVAFRRAWKASGWPAGMRHEAISAAAIDALYTAVPDHFCDVDMDLVRHLVASHHGRSRPLLPAVLDDSPCEVPASLPDLERSVSIASDTTLIDWSAPGRFERLGSAYGWWGLALLESVVRLADQAVSREYGVTGDEDTGSSEDEQ